jgi:hypothetical protein
MLPHFNYCRIDANRRLASAIGARTWPRRIADTHAPANEVPAYLKKYGERGRCMTLPNLALT